MSQIAESRELEDTHTLCKTADHKMVKIHKKQFRSIIEKKQKTPFHNNCNPFHMGLLQSSVFFIAGGFCNMVLSQQKCVSDGFVLLY